jgi:hypothetical protein
LQQHFVHDSESQNHSKTMKTVCPPNKFHLTLALAAFLAGGLIANAQTPTRVASTGGNSPHETTSAVIDGNRVTITYGRPYTKHPKSGEVRKIWGGLVPYGKAWRLGSDEATLLITQQPITLGGVDVPAGAYTLYMVPNESGASKLAISKKVGQWGVPVDEGSDLARVDLTKGNAATPADQLTMAVQKNPSGGGLIKITWENTEYSVPFTIKK